jgi:hypothetical protein
MHSRLPPERLYRAVITNMNSWMDDLEQMIQNADADTRAKALHLKRNILCARIALARMAGDPDAAELPSSEERMDT